MNRSILFLVLVAGLLLVGCRARTQPYLQRTSITLLERVRPAMSVEDVSVFERRDEVPDEYDVIALMQAEGYPEEAKRFRAAFRERAAAVGADGLVFKRINLDDGSGVRLSNVAAFRGEAIVVR